MYRTLFVGLNALTSKHTKEIYFFLSISFIIKLLLVELFKIGSGVNARSLLLIVQCQTPCSHVGVKVSLKIRPDRDLTEPLAEGGAEELNRMLEFK